MNKFASVWIARDADVGVDALLLLLLLRLAVAAGCYLINENAVKV